MSGKYEAKTPSRLSRLVKRIGKIPHLFAKVTIAYCVAAASGASWYALRIMSRTGNDPAALLGVILGFFGGELLVLTRIFHVSADWLIGADKNPPRD